MRQTSGKLELGIPSLKESKNNFLKPDTKDNQDDIIQTLYKSFIEILPRMPIPPEFGWQ